MTKRTMINNYRKYSKADSYIIGFTYNKNVYMVEVMEIMPRFLNVEAASRNQGMNLRLRLTKAQKQAFMKKNPVCLGSIDLLTATAYNKGENFEKAVTEYFGQVWEKDNIPFYMQGDINIDGKKVQIKLDTATLTNTKQLAKLKKVA